MDSKLILCNNIKLDKSYANVLSFGTNAMLDLINSNKSYEQDNYNYIDYTKNEIMADVDYNTAINCNYIAFQNPRHGNKWYFAFIDDVIFKAPRQTFIKFTIDVWSTFFGDWSAKPCFVVREHVNSDNVGEHTVPESVTLGDYVCTKEDMILALNDDPRIIISATTDEGGTKIAGNIYNGIPTAYNYYLYSLNDLSGIQTHINNAIANGGNINQMFIAPKWIVGGTIGAHLIGPSNSPQKDNLIMTPITQLDSYTPTNKKLLTYPYCYHKLSNMQGQDSILHQELWKDSTSGSDTGRLVEVSACLTPGCSVKAIPLNYDGETASPQYGISGPKYPQLNWEGDSYINWLTQQGINSTVQATEDIITQPLQGIQDIGNLLYSNYRAHKTPPQVYGNNTGDVMFARGFCSITGYNYTIKQEYARQIDKYFSRYGYKVNDVKTPNITGRANFNFIEIGKDDCIGYGNVPPKYMEEINNICRQGVTIWHNHTNLGNYNIANGIV